MTKKPCGTKPNDRMPYGVTLRSGDKWTLVVDDTDFVFYKMECEKERKIDHEGWPDEYPCLVRTEYRDGGDYADNWYHEFVYVQDVFKLWDLVKDAVPQAVANELMRDK